MVRCASLSVVRSYLRMILPAGVAVKIILGVWCVKPALDHAQGHGGKPHVTLIGRLMLSSCLTRLHKLAGHL